jgi:hypothetical protein
LAFAWESAGSSIAAKMAMMAMTTSNSIKVKPDCNRGLSFRLDGIGLNFDIKGVGKIISIALFFVEP